MVAVTALASAVVALWRTSQRDKAVLRSDLKESTQARITEMQGIHDTYAEQLKRSAISEASLADALRAMSAMIDGMRDDLRGQG